MQAYALIVCANVKCMQWVIKKVMKLYREQVIGQDDTSYRGDGAVTTHPCSAVSILNSCKTKAFVVTAFSCVLPALKLLGTIKDKSVHFANAIKADRIPQAEPRAEQILLNHFVRRRICRGRSVPPSHGINFSNRLKCSYGRNGSRD